MTNPIILKPKVAKIGKKSSFLKSKIAEIAKKPSLLEQARKIKVLLGPKQLSKITDDHIELAIAWARGEIRLVQATAILYSDQKMKSNIMSGRTVYFLGQCLKEAVARGILK